MLVAFDSNVPTSFLNANSKPIASVGDDLASLRLKWVWYHFPEAQLGLEAARIDAREHELQAHHPERDADDCRIIAEAERAAVDVLATIDRKVKRLQSHTVVRLLTPAGALEYLGIGAGAQPRRVPANGHPLREATWWRL